MHSWRLALTDPQPQCRPEFVVFVYTTAIMHLNYFQRVLPKSVGPRLSAELSAHLVQMRSLTTNRLTTVKIDLTILCLPRSRRLGVHQPLVSVARDVNRLVVLVKTDSLETPH